MHDDIKVLRDLERETLSVIGSIGLFSNFAELYGLAQSRTSVGYIGGIDIEFSLNIDMRIRGDKGPGARAVYVGVLVVPTEDGKSVKRASYYVMICDNESANGNVLRKLHFDYEPRTYRNSAEIKPSVHLQVAGKLSQKLEGRGFKSTQLDGLYPAFEKPRIPTLPISLAILLNWLLLEFQGDITAKRIANDPQWRNHVAKAERTVLSPFLARCSEFFSMSANKNSSFYKERLYEE